MTGKPAELSGECRFLPGDRIELTAVTDDYQRFALKFGDRGTVELIDSLATIHVRVGKRHARRDHCRVGRPCPQDRRAAMTEIPGKPDRSTDGVGVR